MEHVEIYILMVFGHMTTSGLCWRDKHGEEEKEKARIKYHETEEKMNEEELMLREKNHIKKANRSRQ